MKLYSMLIALLWGALLFSSCGDSEIPAVPGNYSEGVFVVNEGPFGGTGTITWYNPKSGESVQDVFGRENQGAALGQFVQSMYIDNDKIYIVVNGANKIVVVNAITFEYLGTISGLHLPRFFYPIDGQKAYVSQWGDDGLSGSIALVDLLTHQVIQEIPTGSGPEKMWRKGDLLYVANSGGFGVDSTVSVINIPTHTAVDRLHAGAKNPGCLLQDVLGNNDVYTLCRGYYLDSNPKGALVRIGSAAQTIATAAYADDLCASPDATQVFWSDGSGVWRMHANNIPEKIIFQSCYGFNCNPVNGALYCANPRDYNSNGEVVRYNPDGTESDRFNVGIAPGEIIFIP